MYKLTKIYTSYFFIKNITKHFTQTYLEIVNSLLNHHDIKQKRYIIFFKKSAKLYHYQKKTKIKMQRLLKNH